MLTKLVEKIYKKFDYRPEIKDYQRSLENDDPPGVFDYLQRDFGNCSGLTIDITGGKKSMVAGAFLFAAYSDTQISYIDFDKYSTRYHRPYGYLCKPTLFNRPYQVFALRDWTEIKELCQKHSFSAALKLLQGIQKIMQEESYFREEDKKSSEKLKKLLELYKAWDNADYPEAKKLYQQLEMPVAEDLPTIIHKFSGNWPVEDQKLLLSKRAKEIKKIGEESVEKIFGDPEKIYVYVNDELAKAERLIKYYEDYRSALIRGAAASELLITARVTMLCEYISKKRQKSDDNEWMNVDKIDLHKLCEYISKKRQKSDDNEWMNVDKIDLHKLPISQKRNLLLNKNNRKNEPKDRNYIYKLNEESLPEGSKKRLEEFREQLDNLEKLAEIRNAVVHGCLPVGRDLAEECLKIARKNCDEFRLWLKKVPLPGVHEAMPWEKVKEVCGLEFVPEVKHR